MEDNFKKFITKSPGKVLLCGGYLILNPEYCGLVVSVDVYFTTTSTVVLGDSSNNIKINVKSVNFNTTYNFYLSYNCLNDNINIELKGDETNYRNEFIENALLFGFYLVAVEFEGRKKDCEIFQGIKEINFELEGDLYFYNFDNGCKANQQKTGLGSSSALITSLLANVFLIFNTLYGLPFQNLKGDLSAFFSLDQQASLVLFSQLANNYAQKKVC
jgi:phosphomevalonate kinase